MGIPGKFVTQRWYGTVKVLIVGRMHGRGKVMANCCKKGLFDEGTMCHGEVPRKLLEGRHTAGRCMELLKVISIP